MTSYAVVYGEEKICCRSLNEALKIGTQKCEEMLCELLLSEDYSSAKAVDIQVYTDPASQQGFFINLTAYACKAVQQNPNRFDKPVSSSRNRALDQMRDMFREVWPSCDDIAIVYLEMHDAPGHFHRRCERKKQKLEMTLC